MTNEGYLVHSNGTDVKGPESVRTVEKSDMVYLDASLS